MVDHKEITSFIIMIIIEGPPLRRRGLIYKGYITLSTPSCKGFLINMRSLFQVSFYLGIFLYLTISHSPSSKETL